MLGQAYPPLAHLKSDKCLRCRALGVQGIEFLFEPFLGALPGVDGASDPFLALAASRI
jgi:hypothetical protein